MQQEIQPFIRTEKVSVTYNVGKANEFQSLKEVSVGIYPEEFTIIFGPSGCGKSTLLYSISALQKPTTGEVYIGDYAISKMNAKNQALLRQTTIGMIFQSFYLIPSLNVLDNVCLPKIFRSEKKKERREEGMQLLRRFGIAEQADKYPSQLSGGQKQRVAIARSLINNPAIILADEPVGNLDSKSAQNVLEILQELRTVDKKSVVLVTHDPSHLALADRILFMKDGVVVEERCQKSSIPTQKKEGVEVINVQGDEQVASKELSVLLRSFSGMPKEQSRIILNPFKADKIIDYILRELSEEQIAAAKVFAARIFFESADFSEFEHSLDKDMYLGGAGWDKRRAEAARGYMEGILKVSDEIRKKGSDAPEIFLEYINKRFSLHQEEESPKRKAFLSLLEERLLCNVGIEEIREILDKSPGKGGFGFHRALAGKIAREIEMVMLMVY